MTVPNSVAELGPLIGRALKGEVGEPHRNIPADVEPGAPAGVSKGSPLAQEHSIAQYQ